jgi:hypothetical protein
VVGIDLLDDSLNTNNKYQTGDTSNCKELELDYEDDEYVNSITVQSDSNNIKLITLRTNKSKIISNGRKVPDIPVVIQEFTES